MNFSEIHVSENKKYWKNSNCGRMSKTSSVKTRFRTLDMDHYMVAMLRSKASFEVLIPKYMLQV